MLKAPGGIQSVLRRTAQLISGRCESQKVMFTVNAPDEPLTLVGDSAQIQQLLLNLALNALDAMPDGGKLDVSVSANESTVEIAVNDTGPGIQNSVLPHLFTPFVTTKPNGVGLGLGICRRIAESHHGTLCGKNSKTGGAVFLLSLPISNALAKKPLTINTTEAACNVS